MNDDETEIRDQEWAGDHPWLCQVADSDEMNSLDEVIRYTLDEIRLQ